MKHSLVIEKDSVTGLTQGELPKGSFVCIRDLRDAARDILAIDQHDESAIHTVTMSAFRGREAGRISTRFDAELMQLDMPTCTRAFCGGKAGENFHEPLDQCSDDRMIADLRRNGIEPAINSP